jgi:hypothetical protein
MNCIQLEFDLEKSELDRVKEDTIFNFNRIENVRKGVFKKHSMLSKEVNDLKQEMELIKNQMGIIEKFLNEYCGKVL